MINSLRPLRARFEKALLAWLHSSLQSPMATEKRDALSALSACIEQLRQSEPTEPYWEHSQALLDGLLHATLADQPACRKAVAQINLLLAQKIQNRHLIPPQLWHDTLKLQLTAEGGGEFIRVNDVFLQNAEHWLQRLKEINTKKKTVLSTPAEIGVALQNARGMLDLAHEAKFSLLLKLSTALERLFLALQKSARPWTPEENTTLNAVLQSMHSLLHQAAAGIVPKHDETFLHALLACEQATSVRYHS